MDSELAQLQVELAQVQEADSVQRLSERNAVQLVLKLMHHKLVDLVYTFTGKEYLTLRQCKNEILDEVYLNGGRVRLDEVSASLKVDSSIVLSLAKELVEEQEDMSMLSTIEIITTWYLDTCAKAWNERLQEVGQMTVGEIATTSDLPVDIVTSAVKSRLDTIIVAHFNQGVLYTAAYVSRQKALVRGIFFAVTQPLSVSAAAATHKLDSSDVERMVKELIEEGLFKGKLSGGEYVPNVFAVLQRQNIDTFFRDNGLIEMKFAKKMNVKNPYKFICETFPQAVKLHTCIISHELSSRLEASVDECVVNGTAFDVKSVLPSQLNDKDCSMLLSKLPAIRSRKSATAKVFLDMFVVSVKLLSQVAAEFKQEVEKAAAKAAETPPPRSKKPAPVVEKKSKKQKKGKKGAQRGNEVAETVEPSHSEISLDRFEQRNDLGNVLSNLSGVFAERGDLRQQVIAHFRVNIREWFLEAFNEASSSVHRGDAAKARKVQAKIEKEFQSVFPTFQMFLKGFAKLTEESPLEADMLRNLELELIQRFCLRFTGQAVHLLCCNAGVTFAPEEPEKWYEDKLHCVSVSKELSEELQKQINKLYQLLNKTKTDLIVFAETFETFVTDECSIIVRKLDKKTERVIVHGHRQMLIAELKVTKEVDKAIGLASLLILQQCNSIVLPLPEPGTAYSQVTLPGLCKFAMRSLNEEQRERFKVLKESEGVDEEALSDITSIASLKDPTKFSLNTE